MSRRPVAVGVAVVLVSVGGTASAASSHRVEITSPETGATVEGTVLLRARTTGPVGSVQFSWGRDTAGPWTTIGPAVPNSDATVWTLQWDSDGIDGAIKLRAVASDGTTEVIDVIDLVLDNRPNVTVAVSPDPFSPNGDGRKDRTTIRVGTHEQGQLVIEVLDPNGEIRRRWRRDAARETDVAIGWNGRADGTTLADGRYRVRAVVTDDAGLTGRASDPVVIDTRAPRLRWIGIRPEPLEDEDRVRFRFRVVDRGPIDVDVRVSDRTGRVGRTGRTVLSGHRAIRWRARYAGGAKLYPGQYGAALIATDEAGNDRRSAEAPWRVHRKVRAHVYTRLPSAGRRVALTFDDCFREDSWRSILRTLRQRRTDATFFCTGAAAARAPSLLRRTVRDGHVFGSHTWDHARLTTVGRSGTANRIARVGALSWSVARHTTAPYFRPPFGLWDSEVLAGARAASHPRVIMWDVDPRDWTFPGMRTIVRRSVGPARGGSIILLHTIPQTAHALRGIITGLRRKGLRPVTVAELFRAAGYRSG